LHKFTGEFEITYMNVIIPGEGSLVATPGREVDFDALGIPVPDDGRWIPVEPQAPKAPKAAASKES